MLDAQLPPLCGSGQRAMSPDAKIAGTLRFEMGITDDAAINGEPGPFGKFGPRAHADTGDHKNPPQA